MNKLEMYFQECWKQGTIEIVLGKKQTHSSSGSEAI
jgi:hypothetical protein